MPPKASPQSKKRSSARKGGHNEDPAPGTGTPVATPLTQEQEGRLAVLIGSLFNTETMIQGIHTYLTRRIEELADQRVLQNSGIDVGRVLHANRLIGNFHGNLVNALEALIQSAESDSVAQRVLLNYRNREPFQRASGDLIARGGWFAASQIAYKK